MKIIAISNNKNIFDIVAIGESKPSSSLSLNYKKLTDIDKFHKTSQFEPREHTNQLRSKMELDNVIKFGFNKTRKK